MEFPLRALCWCTQKRLLPGKGKRGTPRGQLSLKSKNRHYCRRKSCALDKMHQPPMQLTGIPHAYTKNLKRCFLQICCALGLYLGGSRPLKMRSSESWCLEHSVGIHLPPSDTSACSSCLACQCLPCLRAYLDACCSSTAQ